MRPPIPNLVVELDRPRLMAYGAATWDWHRLHYDSDLARERGFGGPIADGQMFGALIARQIRKWAGPHAKFIEMEFKNRRVLVAPNVVTIASRVASCEVCGECDRLDILSAIHDREGMVVVDNARTVL
ncbi:MAG: hypothetical protein IT427_14720, partial [Pirellulales bacterium]|nr:hypothetical protein [Pirellulales bacterium]